MSCTHALTPAATCWLQVRLGALVAGALDVHSASPRRLLFQVLAQHAADPTEAQRLAYFGSAEGRDDLARYNQREGACVHAPKSILLSCCTRLAAMQA